MGKDPRIKDFVSTYKPPKDPAPFFGYFKKGIKIRGKKINFKKIQNENKKAN